MLSEFLSIKIEACETFIVLEVSERWNYSVVCLMISPSTQSYFYPQRIFYNKNRMK